MKDSWKVTSKLEVDGKVATIKQHASRYKLDPMVVVHDLIRGRTVRQIFNKRILEVAEGIRDGNRYLISNEERDKLEIKKNKYPEAASKFDANCLDLRQYMIKKGWRP